MKDYILQSLRGMSDGSIIAICFLVCGTAMIFLFHYLGIAGLLLALVFCYVGLQITRKILNVPKRW